MNSITRLAKTLIGLNFIELDDGELIQPSIFKVKLRLTAAECLALTISRAGEPRSACCHVPVTRP